MKNKLQFVVAVVSTVMFASCSQPGGSAGPSGIITILPLLIVGIIIMVAIKTNKSEDDNSIPIPVNQTNKVVNVTLNGGLIGLFSSSPQSSLNNRIIKENANGWRVIQVIPADSGNIFLFIFRLLLLMITFFLYTTANGYYVIMERTQIVK